MTMRQHQFGKSSEELAARYLKKRKYKILAQNYRTRFGEVDIVARHKRTIVFVEVKSRKTNRFGHPKGAVTRQKQKKMTRVALHYLKQTGQNDAKARFDVVSIQINQGKPEIEVIENAFDVAS